MINEDINSKAISMEMKIGKFAVNEVIKILKRLLSEMNSKRMDLSEYLDEKFKGSGIPLKDLVKKGQLENIDIKNSDFKELKKELNKYGVRFSVMKDKENNNYSVFFQSKDTVVMDKAFKNVIAKIDMKESKKESTLQAIRKFKEKSMNLVVKDRIKNKSMEKSL